MKTQRAEKAKCTKLEKHHRFLQRSPFETHTYPMKSIYGCILVAFIAVSGWTEDIKYELYSEQLVKKAETGDADSQLRLGDLYERGEGINKNLKNAVKWYTKSANQGNPKARFFLGRLYYLGNGVNKDLSQAEALWIAGAAQGDVWCQYSLGALYQKKAGLITMIGTNQVLLPSPNSQNNLIEAEKWYKKAAEQGFKPAYDELKSIKEIQNKSIQKECLGSRQQENKININQASWYLSAKILKPFEHVKLWWQSLSLRMREIISQIYKKAIQKGLQKKCENTTHKVTLNNESGTVERLYKFKKSNVGIIITGYTGKDTDIIIPHMLSGEDVIAISDKAFYETPVKRITLPRTLLTVGKKAFANCRLLQEVVFNEQLKEIGDMAFMFCNLKELHLPKSVEKIGSEAFSWNKNMLSVCISNEFAQGYGLFDYCLNLNKVSLPDSMTNIPPKLFANCWRLQKIKLPNGVTKIGAGAFLCSGLRQITWPNSIKLIEPAAFASCTNLSSVIIPQSVTNISGVFQLCKRLERVEIPNSLNEIGWSAFRETPNLKQIKFNGRVISEWAFSESGLENVELPNCEVIGKGAFAHCQKLASISVGPYLRKIDAYAFRDCQSLTSITLPSSGLDIDNGAFENCRELSEIKILGNNVKIMPNAYEGCIKLKTTANSKDK